MHYFCPPAAVQAPIHIIFTVIDSGYWLAWNFPHVSKVRPPKETILSTSTTTAWMNMNDYDEICRRSESLIKDSQPVTYGNVSQWISDCPGFSFLLLCY